MSKPLTDKFSGTKGEGAGLISKLDSRKEKYNKEDVVAITTDSNGKIVWLEKGHLGDKASGLAHIIDKHGADFERHGISISEIPQYLMIAVRYGTIIGYQGRDIGRPIYQFKYEGVTRWVAITIGSNGYIVGANPRSMKEK